MEPKQLLAADLVSQEENGTLETAEVANVLPNAEFVIEAEIGDHADGNNDIDLFQVEMVEGQQLLIDVVTPYSSSLDSYVRVFDESGSPVSDPMNQGQYYENDDEGYGTTDSYLAFTAPSTGTFFVGVSSSGNSTYDATAGTGNGSGGNSSGEYTLKLSRVGDVGDTIYIGQLINLENGPVSITTDIGDSTLGHNDVDMYEVELVAGQEVTIDLDTPNSSLDTYIRLFDSQGNPVQDPDNPSNYLENDDEGYGTTDSYLSFTVPTTGIYFIGVSSSGNSGYSATSAGSGSGGSSSGEYTILVSAISPDISDTTTGAFELDLTGGQAEHTSVIGDGLYGFNDVDMFQIELILGQEVTIELNTPNSSLDTYARLFDSQGNPVEDPNNPNNYLENDDKDYTTTDSYLSFTVPATGVYFVGVSSSGNSGYVATTAGSGSGGSSSGEYTILVSASAPLVGPVITVLEGATPLISGVSVVEFGSASNYGSVSKIFQIDNPGTETLVLDAGSLQLPSGYALVGSFPTSIEADGSANFELELASSTIGSYSGTVSFLTNDPSLSVFEFDVQGEVTNLPPVVTSLMTDHFIGMNHPGIVIYPESHFYDFEHALGQETLSFTASTDDGNLVTLSQINGNIHVNFVTDAYGIAEVTITATDEHNQSVSDTFRVIVVRPNVPPEVVGPLGTVNLLEDFEPFGIPLNQVFEDPDALIYDETLSFQLLANINNLSSSPSRVRAYVVEDQLWVTTAPNQHGKSTIIVRAYDTFGAHVDHTFVIDVESVNDAPVIAKPILDQMVPINGASSSFDLTRVFFDPDIATDGDILTFTVHGNTDPSVVNAAIQNGQLTLTPQADQFGTATLTIRATDLELEYVDLVFEYTVSYEPQAPHIIDPLPDLNLLEDANPVLIDLDQHFDDIDIAVSNDELIFTFEIEKPEILTASVNGSQLTLTPQADASGKSLVTITATDTTGKSVSDSFYVDIEAVNDAPVVLISPDDLSYSEGVTQTVFDLSKIFFDADISWGNDSLTYSVVSNNNSTLATPSFVGDYLVVDYTEEETGGVTLKIRATDIENEFAEFEVVITITEAEEGVTAIGAITDFDLVNDTGYQALVTSNASVIGRVHRIDETAELVIEFDHDNDGTPEGYRMIQAEEGSLINYDYVVYDPRYSDPAMESYTGPVTLQYRSGLIDETGVVTTYLPWDSFSFELVAPDASYLTSAVSLVEDTGHSSTDKITTNPQLEGTVGVNHAFAEIELDWDGNEVVDSVVFADEEGEWTVTPLVLAYGVVDVHHRVRHWDLESGSFVRGPWSTFTFTLEPEAAPAIQTLHLLGEEPQEEEYPEGPPAEPSTTSAPVLVGSLVSPSTEEEPEEGILDDISQLEIQFDLTGNQQPDDSTFTDANGNFSYVPRGLSEGSNTIAARSVRIDWRTGEEIFGPWKQYSFIYEANPIPEVEQLRLLNDTGESDTDNISEDVTLIGRFSFTTNGPMFVEFDHSGNNEIDGLTEVYSDGTFVYLPAGLPVGVHTIRARASIWDANSRDFVAGDWTSITLEKVIPVNDPATITEFRLHNDNGIDPNDGITTDPALTGQITNAEGVAYLRLEFDHTGDGSVDGRVNSREDGSFLYVPLGLASDSHTIRARVQEWDYASRQFIHGDWQPISFTIAQPVNDVATIESLVLASDTGSSSSDNITANALLTGTIDNVEGLAGMQIQFDHDNNGTVDGFAFTDEKGMFFYDPGHLDFGSHTIRARVREWDYYTSTYLTGTWTSITFTYEDQPNTAAEFVAIGLANAEQVGTDWVTHDGVFAGRIRNQGSLGGISLEVDRTGNGSADEYAQTDSTGRFRFTPLDLEDGQVTLHVRTREIDPLTGASLTGSWQTFSFIYEELVNDPAAFQSITLPYNTSTDPEHNVTSNPTVTGTVSNDGPVSGLQVQFDTFGDGIPSQFTTTDADGKFNHTLLGLAPGERTVYLRIKEYDDKQNAIYSDWTSFEFELEPVPGMGSTSGVLALELLNGTGMATADNQLTGSLAENLGSGNITIEFDHNGNGQVDGTITGTAGQNFNYLPDGLEPGFHQIKARVAGETTWQSLSFISSEDPESQETQDLINSLGNYGDAIAKIDTDLREALDLSALNHSQSAAGITDTYDSAVSQASSTYYSAIGNANSTYESILASAKATFHSAQAAAGTQFQTDMASYTGDKTQFEFDGFELAQNPNFIAAKPPAQSELPTPPSWNDTPDHFRFDPTKDPVYQAQVAAAQTARTNALRDAYKQYEAALETAAQEGNDAVKAIVATYHEGKRQAEITRRETIENESMQHEGQVKAARIKMQEDLIRLSEQFDKNYEVVRYIEDNYSDLESFSYFFDLEYTEVGDKVPESVKSASLFHQWNYTVENSAYRSTYFAERAIYESEIDAINDALDAAILSLDHTSPEYDDLAYDLTTQAEVDRRNARISFWKTMAAAEYPHMISAIETMEKFKIELAKVKRDFETKSSDIALVFHQAQAKQRYEVEKITHEAEVTYQTTVSELLRDAEIAIAAARHSQVVAEINAAGEKNSGKITAESDAATTTSNSRNDASQNYSQADTTRGGEHIGTTAGNQHTAEGGIVSAETDHATAVNDSAVAAQVAMAADRLTLNQQLANARHNQRVAAIELLEAALEQVAEANYSLVKGELLLFNQQEKDFAEARHHETSAKIKSLAIRQGEMADNELYGFVNGIVDEYAIIPAPDETYAERPVDAGMSFTSFPTLLPASPLNHAIRWDAAEIEAKIKKHEAILKYKTGSSDGSELTESLSPSEGEGEGGEGGGEGGEGGGASAPELGGYYGLLETWRHTTTDIWAEYDKAVLHLKVTGEKEAASQKATVDKQAEDHLLGHENNVTNSAQTRDQAIVGVGQTYQNDALAEDHAYMGDRANETLNQFVEFHDKYGCHFSGMSKNNFQSFVDNVITGGGTLIKTATQALNALGATLQTSQAQVNTTLALQSSQAVTEATKQSIADSNSHSQSAQGLHLTYAKAMIGHEATRDKAFATADALKSTLNAAAHAVLQIEYQENYKDLRVIQLQHEFPPSGVIPEKTMSEASADRKVADLDAQVDYSNAMAAANEQHVILTEDAKVTFAENFKSAFDTYADDSLENHETLNSNVAANANSLTSKLATSSTTAANSMADAEQTYTTSAGTTEADLQNDLTPHLNDHQTNLVVNQHQYLVNIKSDHVTALTTQDDGSYFSSANIAQATADSSLATDTATYAETLSTDIGAAVTGMVSSLSSVMTTQIGAMATTLGTLAKETAATASAQWIASAQAGSTADKGVFNTEDAFDIATAKASVKAHVDIVKAEAKAKKAFAANSTAWVETMAPAKKTFELTKDDDLAAAQAVYDGVLATANDTLETANRTAQQTQASEHGDAMIGYAGDYKTALTARAGGIGTAETAYTGAISQAASARTSQDGSSISAAVASAQAADYQALTGTQSAMSTFGTASSTAGTQYLASTKPKLVDFASASTAAHWDYQEGHAAEKLTKAQAAATANPTTETAITLAKAEGHQVYVDGLRGEAITFAKTMVGDMLTHQQDVQSTADTLAADASTKINEFTQAAHNASSAHQLAQLQAANTHESNLVAAAGQLSISQTTASGALGNQLSDDYGKYLVDVYTALKKYGKDLHDKTESVRVGAEDVFDAALLTLDLTQISKTATADLAWAQSASTNLQSFNQSSVTADAAFMKSGATARYAFDTGMAASQKQLTIDLGQKFRTAQLGFHNADTALMVDQATATGNFSLSQANKQLAGAEKLHLELDLPYTQFLVDRATADADYAAEARQLLIGHALNINDDANIRITADQLASSITESANAAAVQGHANTVASSLSSGTQAIAGSLGSSGTALASAIQSYQQAETQIQATHRTATQQAERQFQHDEDTAARDVAIATANETRDDALKTLREAYVTQEVTLDGAHRVKVASEQLAHTNNVGQSRISTTTAIAGNLRDYLHDAADRDESFAHDMADLVVGLGENLAEERLAAHDAIFAEDDTPWGVRHLAEEVAAEDFAKTVLPAEGVLAKDRATATVTAQKAMIDAEHDRAIGEIQADVAREVAEADTAEIHAADHVDNQLENIPVVMMRGEGDQSDNTGGNATGDPNTSKTPPASTIHSSNVALTSDGLAFNTDDPTQAITYEQYLAVGQAVNVNQEVTPHKNPPNIDPQSSFLEDSRRVIDIFSGQRIINNAATGAWENSPLKALLDDGPIGFISSLYDSVTGQGLIRPITSSAQNNVENLTAAGYSTVGAHVVAVGATAGELVGVQSLSEALEGRDHAGGDSLGVIDRLEKSQDAVIGLTSTAVGIKGIGQFTHQSISQFARNHNPPIYVRPPYRNQPSFIDAGADLNGIPLGQEMAALRNIEATRPLPGHSQLVQPGGAAQAGQAPLVGGGIVKSFEALQNQGKVVGKDVASTTTSTGRYGDLSNELRGTGQQANHLNQNAAYRSIIPEEEGLSHGLRGNAFTEPGTPHFEFHRSLESFWNQYRRGGPLHGLMPTNAQYGQALQKSLEVAGLSPAEVADLITQSAQQRAAYGLLESADVPRIPGRLPQRQP